VQLEISTVAQKQGQNDCRTDSVCRI